MRYKVPLLIVTILIAHLLSVSQCCSADSSQYTQFKKQYARYKDLMPETVLIQVTVLDAQKHPVAGAGFDVHDAAHRLLEDPDEVARCSDEKGEISYHVPQSGAYYIQAFAESYLPSEVKKVVSTAKVISVTFVMKRAALPTYPITTIRATIVDTKKHPVVCAFFDTYSASGRDTHNLRGLDDLASDSHGHVEKTIRAGGVLHIRVMAGGYDSVETIVRAKPGVIPIVIVLKRNGDPLPMGLASD